MNLSRNILRYQSHYKLLRYIAPNIEIFSVKVTTNENNLSPTLGSFSAYEFRRCLHSNKLCSSNFREPSYQINAKLNYRYLSLMLATGISLTLIYEFFKESLNCRILWHNMYDIRKCFVVSAASPIFKTRKEDDTSSTNNNSSIDSSGNRFRYNFIADVVDKVSDGVVFIEIKDHRRRDVQGRVLTMSNGSGFIVDSEGMILTNAHVVANKPRASTIMVRLADGREFEGKIEDFDAVSDLALVRIKSSGLKPLTLGSSKDIRPGEFVVALGSPLSLSNTITSGVVSSIGRASKDLGLHGKDIHYIQTDAAITFGNSGGPLVNLDGEVIAINSMKVTSGISFAIPIDYAKDFLEKIKKKKSFLAKYKKDDSPGEESLTRRRYLGITMLSLSSEVITQMQQRGPENIIPANVTHGILVWRIVVGSPAYHAGLEPGDIVTHINGHEVHSSRDVYKILESKADLKMVVNRKGERYNVTVSPEE